MAVDDVGRAYLIGSVRSLHPEEQTVTEMLQGWRNQQLSNLEFETIEHPHKQVQRFIEHSNEFPWTWTVAMVDEFFGDLRSIHKLAQSSIRSYQVGLRQFCSYVSDPDYGWDRVCERCSARIPPKFFDWNTAVHVQDNEAVNPSQARIHQTRAAGFFRPRRRPGIADRGLGAEGLAAGLPRRDDVQVAYSYGLFSGAPAACVSAIL